MDAVDLAGPMNEFSEIEGRDVTRLIKESPLCWIVPHADPTAGMLMPVTVEETSDGGGPLRLLGHLPIRSPATDVFGADPKASFFFLGPNAYVSPSIVGRDTWGPTWNFASARLEAEMRLDRALTRSAVEAITQLMERDGSWTLDRMGPRGEALLSKIVGFHAQVVACAPRLKLGQDENLTDHDSIRQYFGDGAIGRWMDRMARPVRD